MDVLVTPLVAKLPLIVPALLPARAPTFVPPATLPPDKPTFATTPPLPMAPNRPTLFTPALAMVRLEMIWPVPSRLPVKAEPAVPTGMKPVVPQISWPLAAVVAALKLLPSV
ncbi:hypothetical protein JAB8_29890 [Janthinobacterium sp. HH106]|nr:hypothetical protein JAB8_29890 [Janthinobacterium sp. HH106]